MKITYFETNEFEKYCGIKFERISHHLAILKDVFELSLKREDYLTTDVKLENMERCKLALDELKSLSNYLEN